MRECPKCGYVDPPYWRNRLFDYEVDICKLEDLEHIDTDLMIELLLTERGKSVFKSPYVYKLTKTGWVYRIWESLFKVRSWNPQKYYDGSGSKASTLRKMNLQAYDQKQMYLTGTKYSERSKFYQELKELRESFNNLKD